MALFDARDLLKMAVKDEETGIAFYKALAAATRQPQVKAQVLSIAAQEELHARRFQGMLDARGDTQPMEEWPGQYDDYMNALLETRAFPDPAKAAERARSVMSDVEAINIAIRLEKDTLVFLGDVKTLLPKSQHDAVEAVIDEERQHLVELGKLKKLIR